MSKRICFDCRGYSTGACNFNNHLVAKTGNAFRPPRKTKLKEWSELRAILLSQKQLYANNLILYGFGGNWYWDHPKHYGIERFSKRLRNRNFIINLKDEYHG